LCAPDQVDSVCALMKRYENMENGVDIYNAGSGIFRDVGPAGWVATSWHRWLVAVFHLWRGSVMYKIIPEPIKVRHTNSSLSPGSPIISTTNELQLLEAWRDPQEGGEFHVSLAGRVLAQPKVTPWMEVCVPYYNDLIGSEVTPLLQVPGIPSIVYFRGRPIQYVYTAPLVPGVVDAPTVGIFVAVGDDFTLGRFICCPDIDIGGGSRKLKRKTRSALLCNKKQKRKTGGSDLSPDSSLLVEKPDKVRLTAPSRLYSASGPPM